MQTMIRLLRAFWRWSADPADGLPRLVRAGERWGWRFADGLFLPAVAGGDYGQSIFDSVFVKQVIDPKDAATTAQNSAAVDMSQYDVVDFLLMVGNVTGTVDMKAQESTTSGGTYTDITGASITQLAATDDNKCAILSVRPGTYAKRFVRVVVTPTGGTANLVACVALAYPRTGEAPFTLDATVKQLKKA